MTLSAVMVKIENTNSLRAQTFSSTALSPVPAMYRHYMPIAAATAM